MLVCSWPVLLSSSLISGTSLYLIIIRLSNMLILSFGRVANGLKCQYNVFVLYTTKTQYLKRLLLVSNILCSHTVWNYFEMSSIFKTSGRSLTWKDIYTTHVHCVLFKCQPMLSDNVLGFTFSICWSKNPFVCRKDKNKESSI